MTVVTAERQDDWDKPQRGGKRSGAGDQAFNQKQRE